MILGCTLTDSYIYIYKLFLSSFLQVSFTACQWRGTFGSYISGTDRSAEIYAAKYYTQDKQLLAPETVPCGARVVFKFLAEYGSKRAGRERLDAVEEMMVQVKKPPMNSRDEGLTTSSQVEEPMMNSQLLDSSSTRDVRMLAGEQH